MHKIRLFKRDGGWHSQHTDPEVAQLFGTDIIPLPYKDLTSDAYVLRSVTLLNPDCEVVLDEPV